MVNFARMLRGLMQILSVIIISGHSPAFASVTFTYNISNTYGVLLGSRNGAEAGPGGQSVEYYEQFNENNAFSELGVKYDAYANSSGFYFLHHDYCVGSCSVFSSTVISIAITNNDSNPVNLRFDSMITPGHLALSKTTPLTQGSYSFEVFQNSGTEHSLFKSTGTIVPDGLGVDQGKIGGDSFVFNGYTETETGDYKIIDWGATNLSVPLLEIAGNSSTLLSYVATYQVTNDGECAEPSDCSALEVAFGDPRNDGGIVLRAFGPQSAVPLNKAVIGGSYDPFFVPLSIVPVDSPPPPDAPDAPVINYSSLFKSNATIDGNPPAVPEPASWLTMICGFGMVGFALRRRARPRYASNVD